MIEILLSFLYFGMSVDRALGTFPQGAPWLGLAAGFFLSKGVESLKKRWSQA